VTAIDGIGAGFDAGEPPPLPPAAARFLGEGAKFWRLLLRGAVFLLLTLGIYRFWFVTDVRRFLWAHTDIDGDGLEYAGTGRELLLGFLIATVILVPLYIAFLVGATVAGDMRYTRSYGGSSSRSRLASLTRGRRLVLSATRCVTLGTATCAAISMALAQACSFAAYCYGHW